MGATICKCGWRDRANGTHKEATLKLATLLTALLYASSAFAFRLTAGTMEFPGILAGDGSVYLERQGVFTFDGRAMFARLDIADCVYGCDPGQTTSLYMRAVGNDLPGVATLRGVTYTDVGGLMSSESLDIEVVGTMRVPRRGRSDERTTVKLAKLNGWFYHVTVPFQSTVEEIHARVVAIVAWRWIEALDAWTPQSITYDVVPLEKP